ncbi:DNA/RNA non-specific endonuclease [Sorangium sp. So ce1128]
MRKAPLYSLLSDHRVLDDLRHGELEAAVPHDQRAQLDLLVHGTEGAITPGAYTDTEAIILTRGRPSLLVQDGKWEKPRSAEITRRLDPAMKVLEQAVPRVGRVEILGYSLDYIGTGWMLDEDVMVTNRHVAEMFALARGNGFAFRTDADGRVLKSRVDFLREHQRTEMRQANIAEVLFVEIFGDARPDMALVRLERGATGLPEPISLDDGIIGFRDHVAVIGYPAEDPRNDAFVLREIFRNVFGVKRLSPGWISGVRQDGKVLMHDCTTLGGSSGSVIINLATGKACGLHFSGSYLESNYAVTSAALKQRLAQLGPRVVAVPARAPAAASPEGAASEESEEARRRRTKTPAEPSRRELASRKGYDPEFLGTGDLAVPMPEVPEELVAPVHDDPNGELKYTHFSLKMRADRRVALHTACNIDGNLLFNFPRAKDQWFADTRLVDVSHQTDETLYAKNQLDRGHLVRRLDPGWGETRAEGLQGIEDTFFFTNCSPQHAMLNQKTWLSLEDYVLQNAATHALKVTVFTGPVFRDNDRLYRGVQIPEEFWKVVVIVNEFTNRLSATGYLLSQADQLGDLEFVFGEFRTYQIPVAEIEAKTGLTFGDLTRYDPLGSIESSPKREIRGIDDLVL